MSIHFNIEGESAHQVLEEMRTLMTALTGSAPVPRMGVESEVITADMLATRGEVIEPAPKTRKSKKDKEPETIDAAPLSNASTADSKPSASTSSEQDNSSTSASDASSVPDLDDVRAKLKSYKAFMTENALATGATKEKANETSDDLMFKFLSSFGAKNASTIAEAKRAEVMAAVDKAMPTGDAEAATLEDTQAALKRLAGTDGFGHGAVFEVLHKYGAKNAPTVPEDKRAALIAEIDELLKGAK